MKFTPNEVRGLIQLYYQEFENLNVKIEVLPGRIRTSESYMPPRNVISFDVYKPILENGIESFERESLSSEEAKEKISAVLAKSGFDVSNITYDSDANTIFKGIAVEGTSQKSKKI